MKTGQLFAATALAALYFATSGQAQTIDERLAIADSAAGERLFRQCQSCRRVTKFIDANASRVIQSIRMAQIGLDPTCTALSAVKSPPCRDFATLRQ